MFGRRGALGWRALASWIAIASLVCLGATTAVAAGPSPALAAKAPDAAALFAAARARGSVSVIITLRMSSASAADDAALKARVKAVVDPFLLRFFGIRRSAAVPRTLPSSTRGAISTDADAAGIKTMPFLPMIAASLSAAQLERIAADPRVKSIAEDGLSYPVLTQSVPIIGGDQAAMAGATGAGGKIAILDTGVQYTHPFLAGRVTDASCHSTTRGAYRSLCPYGRPSQYGGSAGWNCTGVSCWHGTHVAGIAAGNKPGNTPPRGVAPGATIFSVQIFSRSSSGSLAAFTSDIIAGMQDVYARRNVLKIAALNLSVSGGRSHTAYCDGDPRAAAILQLRNAGVAVVVPSGNDGYRNAVKEPGCVSAAITVGSATKGNVISSFSNMASMVDLMAPGTSITSSQPGSAYGSASGTSMAAPHVAGAIAVLKAAVPSATVDQIEAALKETGVPIVDNRSGGMITRSRIDVYLALLRLRNQPNPPANDDFANAYLLAVSPLHGVSASGPNASATLQPGEPAGNDQVQATIWWKFTANTTESLVLHTIGSTFDTTLGVYTGNSVNALTPVAFSDNAVGNAGRVVVPVTNGVTYYVQVGSHGPGRGVAKLTIDHPPPANDNFADATPIAIDVDGNGSASGNYRSATREAGEPSFQSVMGRTVWYRLNPAKTRRVAILPSGFEVGVAVYSGVSLGALTLVASGKTLDTGPAIRVLLDAGTTYYLQVTALGAVGNNFTIDLSWSSPANDLIADAIPLSGTLTTVYGDSNYGAGTEPGEILAIPEIRNTVYWRFVASSSKTMEITNYSDGDPTLAILTMEGGTLGLVAFNDNDGPTWASRVRFDVVAGRTYYIQVGDNARSPVSYSITLNFLEGASPL